MCPADIHHSTRCASLGASNQSRRRRYISAWPLRYVNSKSDSASSHTVKFTKISGSPRTRTEVELPSSVWCRHTKPGAQSPRRLTRSRMATKSVLREVIGRGQSFAHDMTLAHAPPGVECGRSKGGLRCPAKP